MAQILRKIRLQDACGAIDDLWSPRVIAAIGTTQNRTDDQLGEVQVKLARIDGEFIWHAHDNEDEMFLVIKGRLEMRLCDQDAIMLDAGDMLVVPAGVEHCPVAHGEAWIMLVEPKGTVQTGGAGGEQSRAAQQREQDE